MNKKLQEKVRHLAVLLVLLVAAESVWAQAVPDANGILYVKKGATGNGSSWTDSLGEAADAVKAARELTAGTVTQIWVAGGTYYPLYRADNLSGTNPTDRNNAFVLVGNVKMYGGFAGIETQLTQRDLTLTANASVLSGDYSNNDIITGIGSTLEITNNDENAYHIVISAGVSASNAITNSTVLDGFTICGANANMTGTIRPIGTTKLLGNSICGGIYNYYSSPILSNIIVTGNAAGTRGGGIYNDYSSPIITNFTISRNLAEQGAGIQNDKPLSKPFLSKGIISGNLSRGGTSEGGGGINNFASSPTLIDVEISENHTTKLGGGINNNSCTTIMTNVVIKGNSALKGGGIYSHDSDEVITNCVISGNTGGNGGGMYVSRYASAKSPIMTNVTISRNTADENGGAIYNEGLSLKIRNCIIYGNPTGVYYTQAIATPVYTHSLVQGATTNDANGNIDGTTDPLFTDAANGNYKLRQGSLAVDAGSNNYYAPGSTPNIAAIVTDILGNDRFYDGTPDMGAYELNCAVPNPPTALPQTFCASATVAELTATTIAEATAHWYATADATEALADTAPLQTQTYYVSQAIGSCESTRIPVVITITELPAAPTAAAQTFCGTTTVASLVPVPSPSIIWYASATATEALESTSSLATQSYFVSQKNGDCEGPRTEVAVVINTPDPVVTPQTFCEGATVEDLRATTIQDALVQWYAGGTFGEVLANTYPLTTGAYYVSQTVDGCESRRVQVLVTITPQAIPNFETLAPICKDSAAPTLALVAPNGIAGTWSPAEISTAQTGTFDYVFTPTEVTGVLCLVPQTLSVVVIPKATPDFAPVADVCQGTAAPALALVSPNGVIGTWSPATIDTAQPGTADYVFTPEEGACAIAQTLSITVKNQTPAPTGQETQDFVTGETLADFDVTGENILWYDAPTGGNLLSPTDLIVAGSVYYASQTVASSCGESIVRLKVIAGTELGTPAFESGNFRYYPNPVQDVLTIDYTETIDAATVFNMLGQQVIAKKANGTSCELNFSDLPSGTYIVKVAAGEFSKVLRAVKK